MASNSDDRRQSLTPPAVMALRQEHAGSRAAVTRTNTSIMRSERDDLKEAAEQSLNVILDLALNGTVRWVSSSWADVVGTSAESVKDKPIADFLLSNKDGFANAIESMKKDDSTSRIIRFQVKLGELSVLKQSPVATRNQEQSQEGVDGEDNAAAEEDRVLNLEGQGIIVYDRSSGEDSHTMWMLRPSNPPKEITIDLPELLVESLGLGAEILAHYLTSLADSGATDPENHPPPLPVLCRICERQITPWWFEKHSEGCTQEYRAEEAVTLAQEALGTHRPAIVKVLDTLDPEQRQSRSVPGEPVGIPTPPEYKGLPIGSSTASSSGTDSGRVTPAARSRSRDSSSSGLGHSRGKSFTVRRPLYRVAELIIDLCDTAMAINVPVLKEKKTEDGTDGEIRTQSPHSESLISQIMQWSGPSANTLEQEPGLAALTTDTENLAQAKVEAVLRHREILEYTERIRMEFNALVLDCIEAAVQKAKKIKEGQLSDSSEEDEPEEEAQTPAAQETTFPMSVYDGPSAMATALRNASDPSLAAQFEGRKSSVAASSSRSSSPMECPTPRSHTNSISMLGRTDSANKRHSMLIGSDAGDSDTNLSQSMHVGARRTQSPTSDLALCRSTSSGDKKRRSLRLPNMPSPNRQPSPGRMPAPSSPLRIPKPRLPGLDSLPSLPSPITSPPLSGTEMSSPVVGAHHHRRQSSAASSVADHIKPPTSPRLAGLSQPPARAVPTSIKDFEIIKPISKGAFGSVYLSKKKSTGDYFAIKVLRKADMVAKNQVTNVKAERAIMMWQGESDFVAKLYWTFSSKDYLFLVMEYLNGGDCAALVKVLGGLPEDWAKKYMAEVVLGIEHLHSRGIVHRDLKPDNLLIDQKGHLKLTDFGLSRMGLIGRQKRALKSPNDSTPDLLKFGPFARNTSMASSRSASFDMQGNHSPQSTPVMTPDLAGSLGQPSYFSLNRDAVLGREHSRRKSGYRSDSGNSDSFNMMFRNFSLNEDGSNRGSRIEEETQSEGEGLEGSPDPYALRPTVSNIGARPDTPPQANMPPPPMALFDPEDQNRRFVGTPDYLAPETINGLGQDEMSDWWSLGCILFEFLFGYPPFHADTPEKVFENILDRKIDWPDAEELSAVSEDAKDLMTKLMTIDPKERLGANMAEQYASGGEQIRQHPFFSGTDWETLLEAEAQFIPAPANPEDTEYFDTRGATLQTFAEEMEDQGSSPAGTPSADYPDRPHDALSRARSQINANANKRGLMPLHIPPHVRDGRNRRLSEPVPTDDFGNFAYKNLPVLQKANNDVLQKLLAESTHRPSRASTSGQSPCPNPGSPSLEGSPLLPMPVKRARSTHKGANRPASPSNLGQPNESPSRPSNPSSPLLVSFSTGQNHERRKTSSTSSTMSHQSSNSLQPGQHFDPPRLPVGFSASSAVSNTSSPIKSNRNSLVMPIASPDRSTVLPRPHSIHSGISRTRSQTVGSQEGELPPPPSKPFHNKRQSQVFDISPSSSDNEDPRAKALLRVQRRRQSSRRMSQIMLMDGPSFRPLDVLICEDHPVSRMVMERLLEKLRCRTISVVNGSEAARIAMSEVTFDIIMMEFKLPQINGADVARMIRDTKSANTQTPIIAVTGYLKELPQTHHFDSLMEKPATAEKLTEALCNLCAWKPPPPGFDPQKQQQSEQQKIIPSGLRQESRNAEDSPSSQSSGPFAQVPGLYKRPSREHSIGSSFFGDTDSTNTEDVPVIVGRPSDEWPSNAGLGITEDMSPPNTQFAHPGLPHLVHLNSAPPALDLRTPRKQRSVEAVKAKRETLEKKRHECAESGDDEDEELGKLPSRAKSPQGKLRGSKLGQEMMRTNSRGSVTSGGDEQPVLQNITSNPDIEMKDPSEMNASIDPPELFPADAKGDAVEVIDMDATPKPPVAAVNAALEQSSQNLGMGSPSPQKKSSLAALRAGKQ
ncbi:rim15, signal transduction response regulator [Lecanora helva]